MKEMTMLEISENTELFKSMLDKMIIADPDKALCRVADEIGISVITLNKFLFTKDVHSRKTMWKLYNYLRKVERDNTLQSV